MKKWLLMLCFVCAGAHAEDWRTVGNSNAAELTVDVDSIKDINGIREAWSMWNFSVARATNDKSFPALKSYKDLQQYNCKDKTIKLTREIIFAELDGQGDKRDHSEALKNMPFSKPAAGTIADIMLQQVCSYVIKK